MPHPWAASKTKVSAVEEKRNFFSLTIGLPQMPTIFPDLDTSTTPYACLL